jgi:hypothetical protein
LSPPKTLLPETSKIDKGKKIEVQTKIDKNPTPIFQRSGLFPLIKKAMFPSPL